MIGIEGHVREGDDGFVITSGHVSFTLFQGNPPGARIDFHIGVSLRDAAAVRQRRADLRALGVEEVEWCEEPGYVSIKIADPDGYLVELSWDESHPPS